MALNNLQWLICHKTQPNLNCICWRGFISGILQSVQLSLFANTLIVFILYHYLSTLVSHNKNDDVNCDFYQGNGFFWFFLTTFPYWDMASAWKNSHCHNFNPSSKNRNIKTWLSPLILWHNPRSNMSKGLSKDLLSKRREIFISWKMNWLNRVKCSSSYSELVCYLTTQVAEI